MCTLCLHIYTLWQYINTLLYTGVTESLLNTTANFSIGFGVDDPATGNERTIPIPKRTYDEFTSHSKTPMRKKRTS